MSNAIDDIIGKLPMQELASKLGSQPDQITAAAGQIIESMIGQLARNASEPQGEHALANALNDHLADNIVTDGELDLNHVDLTDGAKIVQHVFSQPPAEAASLLGKRNTAAPVNTQLVQKLLPLLAPIVLSYLADKLGRHSAAQLNNDQSVLGAIVDGLLGQSAQRNQPQQNFGLADVLIGMLGGQAPQKPQPSGLQRMLGQIFG